MSRPDPIGLFPEPSITASRRGVLAVRLGDSVRASREAEKAKRVATQPNLLLAVALLMFFGALALFVRGVFMEADAGQAYMSSEVEEVMATSSAMAVLASIAAFVDGMRGFLAGRRDHSIAFAVGTTFAPAIFCAMCLAGAWFVAFNATSVHAFLPSTRDEAASNGIAILPDGSGIVLRGPFYPGISKRLAAVLDAHPGARTVYLSSKGGAAFEGELTGQLVRRRGLDTVVLDRCWSACTHAFAMGHRRLAFGGENGGLAYHSAYLPPSPIFGSGKVTALPGASGRGTYKAAGMTGRFIARALDPDPGVVWTPSSGELYDGRAIDGVVDPYALPGTLFMVSPLNRPVPLSVGWRSELLSRHAPAVVDGIRTWMDRGYALGRNRPLMVEAFDRAISRALAGALAESGDVEVRKAGAYLADAMAVARLGSHAHCVRIGAYADLSDAADVDPNPSGSASDPENAWPALFGRVLEGTRGLGWRPGAGPRDIEDASLWTPASRALPGLSCNALVDWYRTASDVESPGGTDRLRALFGRLASSKDGEPVIGAADLASR